MSPFIFVLTAVGLLWLGILTLCPKTRFEQLVMSAFGLLLAPSAMLVLAPQEPVRLSVTDGVALLFVGALFGIAAVLYHVLIEPHAVRMNGRRMNGSHRGVHLFSGLLIAGGIWIILAIVGQVVFALPVPKAFTLGGLLVGIYVVADRKEMLLKALLTGLYVSILVYLTETAFSANLFASGAEAVAGWPLQEILWAAVIGFTAGPLYEHARHVRSS